MTIDIKTLQRLADPAAAQSAAAAGLPTINLDSFKTNVSKMMEARSELSMGNATKMVSSIMDDADKMMNSHMDSMDSVVIAAKKAASSTPLDSAKTAIAAKAANALNAATSLAKLKQAKEHAMSTGNFIPLLALTQPNLSLKSLPKALVVLPKLDSLPSISSVKDSILSKIS